MTPQPNQPIEVTAQHLKCAQEIIQWQHTHNEFLTANVVAKIISQYFPTQQEQQDVNEPQHYSSTTNAKIEELEKQLQESYVKIIELQHIVRTDTQKKSNT